jgi:hypothetical protein
MTDPAIHGEYKFRELSLADTFINASSAEMQKLRDGKLDEKPQVLIKTTDFRGWPIVGDEPVKIDLDKLVLKVDLKALIQRSFHYLTFDPDTPKNTDQ